MTRTDNDSAKVYDSNGFEYKVYYVYKLTYATREYPEELEVEFKGIYDSEGKDVTNTLDEDLKIELENKAINTI